MEKLESRAMFAVAIPVPRSLDGLMLDFYATAAFSPFKVGEHDHVEFNPGNQFRDIDTSTGKAIVTTGTYGLTDYDTRKVIDLNASVSGQTVSLYMELNFANGYGGTYHIQAYDVPDAFDNGNFAVNPQPGVGTIRGVVYDDRNGDGHQNAGEVGFGGQRVFIDKNGNGIWDPLTERARATDEWGRYAFKNINTGYHQVRATPPAGYVASKPASNRYMVILLPGAAAYDRNFAQTNRSHISGQALIDANHNLEADSGDTRFTGSVYLDLDHNGVLSAADSVQTPSRTGYFDFAGVRPGRYDVRIAPPAGYFLAMWTPSSGLYTVSISGVQTVGGLLFLTSLYQ